MYRAAAHEYDGQLLADFTAITRAHKLLSHLQSR